MQGFLEVPTGTRYGPLMLSDIIDLRAFYSTTLGRLAEHAVATALSTIWVKQPNERLVGLGYALPWLERFGADAERVFAFMPATQGAVNWPSNGMSATALVFEEELPLFDSSIDRMLLVHALEHAENPREMLMEIWRVLAPGGRLLIVVPNRRGMWARFEHTPFGTGRPFSRGQLSSLLRETNFTPMAWADGLHFPPSQRRWVMRLHALFERTGSRFWPLFAGVVIVEAQKRVYQGIPVAARASRRVFVPVLSPQGARAMRNPAEEK
jgi:SAM-dependent methyltransferase